MSQATPHSISPCTSLPADGVCPSQTLRLDVLESDQACGPAALKVNNYLLTQDAEGSGTGVLFYGTDGFINATWTFTCDEAKARSPDALPQTLHIALWGLDGLPLTPSVRFSARFRQTAPATIMDITGAHVDSSILITLDGLAAEEDEGVDSELGHQAPETSDRHGGPPEYFVAFEDPFVRQQVEELEALRTQLFDLGQLIFNKEAALLESLGKPMPARSKCPTPIQHCNSLRCVVRAISFSFTRLISHGLRGHPHHPWPPHAASARHDHRRPGKVQGPLCRCSPEQVTHDSGPHGVRLDFVSGRPDPMEDQAFPVPPANVMPPPAPHNGELGRPRLPEHGPIGQQPPAPPAHPVRHFSSRRVFSIKSLTCLSIPSPGTRTWQASALRLSSSVFSPSPGSSSSISRSSGTPTACSAARPDRLAGSSVEKRATNVARATASAP